MPILPYPSVWTLRVPKGSALTHIELDDNQIYLNKKINDTIGQNIGTGVGVYFNKFINPDDGQLLFKSFIGVNGVNVTDSISAITISSSGNYCNLVEGIKVRKVKSCDCSEYQILGDCGCGTIGLRSDGVTFNPDSANKYTFPCYDGPSGYHLCTDGVGQLSWCAGGSGSGGTSGDTYISNVNLTSGDTICITRSDGFEWCVSLSAVTPYEYGEGFHSIQPRKDINYAKATSSNIGGGSGNTVYDTGLFSNIGGGQENDIYTKQSFIGGGRYNLIHALPTIVTGSTSATTHWSGITYSGLTFSACTGGTWSATTYIASAHTGTSFTEYAYSAITFNSNHSSIVGGKYNKIFGPQAFIGGGEYNEIYSFEKVLFGATIPAQQKYIYKVYSAYTYTGITDELVGGCTGETYTGITYSGITDTGYTDTILVYSGVTYRTSYSSILGGERNTIHSYWSAIGGGSGNTITTASTKSIIVGGHGNKLNETQLANIVGGAFNLIESPTEGFTGTTHNNKLSSIVGGYKNQLFSTLTFIGGGSGNTITSASTNSLIVGGVDNLISGATHASIVGGQNNRNLGGTHSIIGGGVDNVIPAGGHYSGVFSGRGNKILTIDGDYSVIGGGLNNLMTGSTWASILGGLSNTIHGGTASGIINGGSNKIVNSLYSTIVGGRAGGIDTSSYSFIGGGNGNIITASTESSIVGGDSNRVVDNSNYGIIGGGWGNVIGGGSITSFIGGGTDNLIDRVSSHSVLGGGWKNKVDVGSINALLGGGLNNLIDTVDFGVLVGGEANVVISNSDYSGILGGSGSTISESLYANVGGGVRQRVLNSSYSNIVGGDHNTIMLGSSNSLIGSGARNFMINGDYSNIVGGHSNTLSASTYASVLGGLENTIQNGNYSVVGGGYGDQIRQSIYSVVGGGQLNWILGGETNRHNVIGGGLANRIGRLGFDDSNRDFIGGGQYNKLSATTDASIVGGAYNHIKHSTAAFIGGGWNNKIMGDITGVPTSNMSFIGAGLSHIIDTSKHSNIVGGIENLVYTSPASHIGGGSGHTITNGTYSTYTSLIGGGRDNVISASTDSFIGGGDTNLISTYGAKGNIIGGGTGHIITASQGHATIVGGLQNKITGYHTSFIGGGWLNQILGSASSIIGGGQLNWIWGSEINKHNAIVGGLSNQIGKNDADNSSRDFIGGGQYNTLSATSDSSIVGGQYNFIATSDNAHIGGGWNNKITGSTTGVIGGGLLNYLLNSGHSDIVGGIQNQLLGSLRSHIGGGSGNTISDAWIYPTLTASIVGGHNNVISGSSHSFIGGGTQNFIKPKVPSFQSAYNLIGGGYQNIITSTQGLSTIVGGYQNIITGYHSSFIGGGRLNSIYTSPESVVVGGSGNWVKSTQAYNFIGGGDANIIGPNVALGPAPQMQTNTIVGGGGNRITDYPYILAPTRHSFIGGGSGNWITGTTAGVIVGGESNRMYDPSRSFVGAGERNYFTGSSDSIIVGGSSNILSGSTISFIGGGYYNRILGRGTGSPGSANYANSGDTYTNSSIVGGYGNTIYHHLTEGGAAILNGKLNTILNGHDYSVIMGGKHLTSNRAYTTFMNGLDVDTNAANGSQQSLQYHGTFANPGLNRFLKDVTGSGDAQWADLPIIPTGGDCPVISAWTQGCILYMFLSGSTSGCTGTTITANTCDNITGPYMWKGGDKSISTTLPLSPNPLENRVTIGSRYSNIQGGLGNYIWDSHFSGILNGSGNTISSAATYSAIIGTRDRTAVNPETTYTRGIDANTDGVDGVNRPFRYHGIYAQEGPVAGKVLTDIDGLGNAVWLPGGIIPQFSGCPIVSAFTSGCYLYLINCTGGTVTADTCNTFGPASPYMYGAGTDSIKPIIGSLQTIGVRASIGGGTFNHIQNSSNARIGGGDRNLISGATGSGIQSGGYNKITKSSYGFIGSGSYNNIGTLTLQSINSFIGAGSYNNIIGTYGYNVIGGGSGNTVGKTAYAIGQGWSNIVGGYDNSIYGQYLAYASIVGGYRNEITGSTYTFIGGGALNKIYDNNGALNYSSIVGGTKNKIDNSLYSIIGGGDQNLVINSNNSLVVGGSGNTVGYLQSAEHSSIVSGTHNRIGADGPIEYASILNGKDNVVGHDYSVIMGSRNVLSDRSYTTFVTGLDANTVAADGTTKLFKYHGIPASPGIGKVLTDSTGLGDAVWMVSPNPGVTWTGDCAVVSAYTSGCTLYMLTDCTGATGTAYILVNGNITYTANTCNTFSDSPYKYDGGIDSISTKLPTGFLGNYVNVGSNWSNIGGGMINNIYLTNAGNIAGGVGNTLYNSSNSGVGSGRYNWTQNSTHCFIGGGNENRISGVTKSFIGGGESNHIVGRGTYSSIAGGVVNELLTYATFIGGGSYNKIISNSDYSSVVGGSSNLIESSSFASSILTGKNHLIKDSTYSSILAGTGNTISNITGVTAASIVNGKDNTIHHNSSAIIGTDGRTTEQSHVTYTNGVDIDSDLVNGGTRYLKYHGSLANPTLPGYVLTDVDGTGNAVWSANNNPGGAGWTGDCAVVSAYTQECILYMLTNCTGATGTAYILVNGNITYTADTCNTFDGSPYMYGAGAQNIQPKLPLGSNINHISGGDNNIAGGANNKMWVDTLGGGCWQSSIEGGSNNIISGATASNITNGHYNIIEKAMRSSIVGGYSNKVIADPGSTGYDFSTGIFQGESNTILSHTSSNGTNQGSTIIGGDGNMMSGATHSSIIGGEDNTIVTSYVGTNWRGHSVILGGSDNTVTSNAWSSAILGGDGLRATRSHTTFMNGLDVDTNSVAGQKPFKYHGPFANEGINKFLMSVNAFGDAVWQTIPGVHSWTGDCAIVSAFTTNNGCTLTLVNCTGGTITADTCSSISGPYAYRGGSGSISTTLPLPNFVNENLISQFASTSNIDGGIDNKIYSIGNSNSILGGTTNKIGTVNTSAWTQTHHAIVGGRWNRIDGNDSHYSIIGGGSGNLLHQGLYNGVFAGLENTITGTTYSTIVGGASNTIYGTASLSFIGGGYTNRINHYKSEYASIVGGWANTITSEDVSENYRAFIGGGGTNTISGSSDSSIVGGYDNIISHGHRNSIVGGIDNSISNVNTGTIVNGSGNTINTNHTSSAIIGGDGLSTDKSYTTFMNGLDVDTQAVGGIQRYLKYHGILSNTGSIGQVLTDIDGTGNAQWQPLPTFPNISLSGCGIVSAYTTNLGCDLNLVDCTGGTYTVDICSTFSQGPYQYGAGTNAIIPVLGGNQANTTYSNIQGGQGNIIQSGITMSNTYSSIESGSYNKITGSSYSTIVSGKQNRIYIGESDMHGYGAILNGYKNKVHHHYSVIMGGANITTDREFTVFMRGLDVNTTEPDPFGPTQELPFRYHGIFANPGINRILTDIDGTGNAVWMPCSTACTGVTAGLTGTTKHVDIRNYTANVKETINHGLATEDVVVNVWSENKQKIDAEVFYVNVNQIEIAVSMDLMNVKTVIIG